MGARGDLIISFGKFSEQDSAWDIEFWQSVDTEQRFHATYELLRTAYKVETGEELPLSIDRTCITTGSYSDDC